LFERRIPKKNQSGDAHGQNWEGGGRFFQLGGERNVTLEGYPKSDSVILRKKEKGTKKNARPVKKNGVDQREPLRAKQNHTLV